MVPLQHTFKKALAPKLQLKVQAADEAYKRMWYDIYRHKMRYNVDAVAQELDLSEQDILEIRKYYKHDEECQLPVKFVTVNLPSDADITEAQIKLDRCLKKCYVGDWSYAFELGHDEQHPHYHVYFTSTVKWLAKSRIISEWSTIFDIDKQYVNVQSTSREQIPNLDKYISKEQILKKRKNKK